LGQDPYHTPGKANGLAFGIAEQWEGNRVHSSFKNITMEVFRLDSVEDINRMWSFNKWATLESWAKQGVLLTNTRLSVAEGQPMSHAGLGWEELVEQTLALTIAERNPILVAFGAEARKFYQKVLKVYRVPADTVTMLCYSHPCKYSATRGSKYAKAFVGSNCFNEINKALLARNQEPINWWKV
jgi:uracil-DNA glycosylase